MAGTMRLAKEMPGSTILVNLSGRGDKDMGTAMEWFGLDDTAEELVGDEKTEQ